MQIIGVEPKRVASFSAALEQGQPTGIPFDGATLADGLAVLKVCTPLAPKNHREAVEGPPPVLRIRQQQQLLTQLWCSLSA